MAVDYRREFIDMLRAKHLELIDLHEYANALEAEWVIDDIAKHSTASIKAAYCRARDHALRAKANGKVRGYQP